MVKNCRKGHLNQGSEIYEISSEFSINNCVFSNLILALFNFFFDK